MEKLMTYLNSIHPLSRELQEHLFYILREKYIPRKQYLLKAGQVCRNITFITKGLLRCYYVKDDREISSWFMKEGDTIISVESFFQQKKGKEYIQALDDCEIRFISSDQLEYIYRNFPEFNFVARVLLQKYYILSEQRLYSLRMQRSLERYDYLLENHSELILRVPSKYLASYLGITEETLSRIRSKKNFS